MFLYCICAIDAHRPEKYDAHNNAILKIAHCMAIHYMCGLYVYIYIYIIDIYLRTCDKHMIMSFKLCLNYVVPIANVNLETQLIIYKCVNV